jgi:hypothetical protein
MVSLIGASFPFLHLFIAVFLFAALVWLAAAGVDLWLLLTPCGVVLLAAAFGMRAVQTEE